MTFGHFRNKQELARKNLWKQFVLLFVSRSPLHFHFHLISNSNIRSKRKVQGIINFSPGGGCRKSKWNLVQNPWFSCIKACGLLLLMNSTKTLFAFNFLLFLPEFNSNRQRRRRDYFISVSEKVSFQDFSKGASNNKDFQKMYFYNSVRPFAVLCNLIIIILLSSLYSKFGIYIYEKFYNAVFFTIIQNIVTNFF